MKGFYTNAIAKSSQSKRKTSNFLFTHEANTPKFLPHFGAKRKQICIGTNLFIFYPLRVVYVRWLLGIQRIVKANTQKKQSNRHCSNTEKKTHSKLARQLQRAFSRPQVCMALYQLLPSNVCRFNFSNGAFSFHMQYYLISHVYQMTRSLYA